MEHSVDVDVGAGGDGVKDGAEEQMVQLKGKDVEEELDVEGGEPQVNRVVDVETKDNHVEDVETKDNHVEDVEIKEEVGVKVRGLEDVDVAKPGDSKEVGEEQATTSKVVVRNNNLPNNSAQPIYSKKVQIRTPYGCRASRRVRQRSS
jgi:hypothetical protein